MKTGLLMVVLLASLALAAEPGNDYLKKSVLTIVTQEPNDCGRITDISRETPDINDLVEVMDSTSAFELGTGFITDHNEKLYIITCEHVLYKAGRITGYDSNYNGYELRLVGTDMFYDVAVLEFVSSIDEACFQGIPFGETLSPKSEVTGIGYWKWSGKPSKEQGNILDSKEKTDSPLLELGYIKSDVQTAGGFSGGPLLNKEGVVIGMNTSVNRKNKTSYALNSELLEKIVHRIIENEGAIQRIFCGIRFTQDETCNQVKIEDIIKDSPAEKHHKKLVNQYIKSVNGQLVSSIFDVLIIMENLRAGDQVAIQLQNDDEIILNTSTLKQENLEKIALHALSKNYKDNCIKKNKCAEVNIEQGKVVITHQGKRDVIKTAGIEEDRIYCLENSGHLGILIRLFGLHGHIELGKDNAHIFIKQIKFSADHDKRVLYY